MATKIIAYRRVSSKKQGDSGLGLGAQEQAINGYITMASGELIGSYTEVETGKRDDLENRPQLMKALAHAGRAKATLVIAKLDRLARSVYVTSSIMVSGVEFVCCDNPKINRLTIHVLAAVAEDEAGRISQRTKDGLAEYKRDKRVSRRITLLYPDGVPADVVEATAGKLGSHLPQCAGNLKQPARLKGAKAAGVEAAKRAAAAYTDLVPDILAWRQMGLSQREIAARLNEEGKETRRGKRWNQVQVKRLLDRAKAASRT